MSAETTMGGEAAAFRTTQWTQVLLAKERREDQALDRLVRAYWKPAYAWIRRRGHSVDQSKDLAQGFFAAFLERDFLQYVERSRGRFRTFLRTALDHFLSDERDRERALKRGGGRIALPLDFEGAEAELGTGPEDPERLFRRKWAVAVMREALDRLRTEYAKAGLRAEFDVLRPHLDGAGAPTYAETAARLGLSEFDATNRLNRLRRRYREAILAELRSCNESETDAEEELRDLFTAFSD